MKYMADESDYSKKRLDTSKDNTREQVAICMIVNDAQRSSFLYSRYTKKTMSDSSSKASTVFKLSHYFEMSLIFIFTHKEVEISHDNKMEQL